MVGASRGVARRIENVVIGPLPQGSLPPGVGRQQLEDGIALGDRREGLGGAPAGTGK